MSYTKSSLLRLVVIVTIVFTFFFLTKSCHTASAATPEHLSPPSRLLIRHRFWQVVVLPVLPSDETGDELVGLTLFDEHVIVISRHESDADMCETLHHEIMHAVSDSTVIQTNHQFIYDESPELVKVYFRDNPALLRYTVSACRDYADDHDTPVRP